jgi:RNA polymerase primary sigma factor
VDEEQLEHLLRMRETVLSLDSMTDTSEEDPIQLANRLRDEHAPDPAEICMARERRALVEAAIATLPAREQRVLRLRFGIGGSEGQSLRAASRELGLSQEGVRRIEQKALHHLRHGPAAQMLTSVL